MYNMYVDVLCIDITIYIQSHLMLSAWLIRNLVPSRQDWNTMKGISALDSRMDQRTCYGDRAVYHKHQGLEVDLNPFLLLCDLREAASPLLSFVFCFFFPNLNLNLHCKFAMPAK